MKFMTQSPQEQQNHSFLIIINIFFAIVHAQNNLINFVKQIILPTVIFNELYWKGFFFNNLCNFV